MSTGRLCRQRLTRYQLVRKRWDVRVARANLEISFGFIESHRRGVARVPLPLQDYRLRLIRRTHAPRAPQYAPSGPHTMNRRFQK